ncbi:MAG TPA: helix-turn-helix domain-containing protein [Patescibacteria group bacterium]|nr:helix-turn-helix domain-containing protein [Patescibacteria group bacterium]
MTQADALKILKSGANVFITGEPGSGKTYTINQYVAYLRSHGIEPAITASTGIAATHIGGMTIHSWSGIGIKNHLSKSDFHNIITNDYIEKRVGEAKVLIIDEISMLPPETLQMVDAICRGVKKNQAPFGGMQVVLVGDFFQLPPIKKNEFSGYLQDNLFDEGAPARFAYDSRTWRDMEFIACYIDEQYRQDDFELVNLLSKIRSNSFGVNELALIQRRRVDAVKAPDHAPKLFSHNIDVDTVNNQMLEKIREPKQSFPMITKGHEALVAIMKKGCLSPENLELKIGAAVMFTRNNPKDGYVNGTLGVVDSFNHDNGMPIVKLRNGRKIEVSYADWTVEEDGKVKGRLTQIPLRLAWAITVHKSQGISLDEAVIDLSSVFEFGQGYVALSRVRRLRGIYILGWNDKSFQVDPEVLKKDQEFRRDSKEAEAFFSRFSEQELVKTQNDFIIFCGGAINTEDVIPKKKGKKTHTINETLKLWKEGKGITQIAEIRALSENTVFSHIERLVEKGKVERKELMRLASTDLKRALPKIEKAFKDLKTRKLTPVFEYFKGRHSYDDLRLARMINS